MNLAFPALLLLLGYLPGALFVLALTGQFSHDLPSVTSITWDVAMALGLAALFHTVALLALHLGGARPDYAVFFRLLSDAPQTGAYAKADAYFAARLPQMLGYFAAVSLCAATSGIGLRRAIAHFELDARYTWLRFNPPWHYLFGGHDRPNARTTQFYGIICEILCIVETTPVIYTGFLTGYWFDDDRRSLDVLFLTRVARRKLSWDNSDQSTDGRVLIPTDRFAIKYSEIKNINVRYLETSAPAAHPIPVRRRFRWPLPATAGLIALVAAGFALLLVHINRIRNDAARTGAELKLLERTLAEQHKEMGARVQRIEKTLEALNGSSLMIQNPFVGRIFLIPENRAVRVAFDLYNPGLTKVSVANLRMTVDNDPESWSWARGTASAIRDGGSFSLEPFQTQHVEAWKRAGAIATVRVALSYASGIASKRRSIGFCRVYDRNTNLTKACH